MPYPEIPVHVIPHRDAESRNTGKIVVIGNTRNRFQRLHFSGPRIKVRGDTVRIGSGVIREYSFFSAAKRAERTKKCLRCYRASSVIDWRGPRGLRNSPRPDTPRLRASVGWSRPGPIKAEGSPGLPVFCSQFPALWTPPFRYTAL